MQKISIGTILSLIIRFENNEISEANHYYLVVDIINNAKYELLEITQFDTIKKKNANYKFDEDKFFVPAQKDTFITKDSYIDLKREIRIENYEELSKYVVDCKLSDDLIKDIISDYNKIKNNYLITKKISILKEELEKLNENNILNKYNDNPDTEDDTNNPPPPTYKP